MKRFYQLQIEPNSMKPAATIESSKSAQWTSISSMVWFANKRKTHSCSDISSPVARVISLQLVGLEGTFLYHVSQLMLRWLFINDIKANKPHFASHIMFQFFEVVVLQEFYQQLPLLVDTLMTLIEIFPSFTSLKVRNFSHPHITAWTTIPQKESLTRYFSKIPFALTFIFQIYLCWNGCF